MDSSSEHEEGPGVSVEGPADGASVDGDGATAEEEVSVQEEDGNESGFALGADLEFVLGCFLMDLEEATYAVKTVWESVKGGGCSSLAASAVTSITLAAVSSTYERLVIEYPEFKDFADFFNAIIGGLKHVDTQHKVIMDQLRQSGQVMADFSTVFREKTERSMLSCKEGYFGPRFHEDRCPLRNDSSQELKRLVCKV